MRKFKFILTTLCCLVGLGCFCNAGFVASGDTMTSTITSNYQLFDFGSGTCLYGSNPTTIAYSYDGVNSAGSFTRYKIYCLTGTIYLRSASSQTARTVSLDLTEKTCPTCPTIDSNYCTSNNLCPSCPSCPSQYTSLECQSEYSLIPISSVDQNYCTTNNLCPSSGGGDCTGSNWSALYINGLQHDSAGVINIDITEDISWDYELTGSQFNLDIIGYNVDYEKIDQIVSIQNYKPSSKDFTQVIGSLVPYMKILVFLLFAFIIIKRLKKPFSSKLK